MNIATSAYKPVGDSKDLQTLDAKHLVDSYQKLEKLIDSLINFDAEVIYTTIHTDFKSKYDLVRKYYYTIENIRNELIDAGVSSNKQDLIDKLDPIVKEIRRNYSDLIEENHLLLDKIFVYKTNENLSYNVEKLTEEVNKLLHKPDEIYEEEHAKMCKIYDILESEEATLKKVKERLKEK